VIIEDSGHTISFDQPDRFNGVLLEFLDDTSTNRARRWERLTSPLALGAIDRALKISERIADAVLHASRPKIITDGSGPRAVGSIAAVAPPSDLQDLHCRRTFGMVRPRRKCRLVPPGRGDVTRHRPVAIGGVLEITQQLPIGEAVGDLASRRHGHIGGENALKPLDVGAYLLPSDYIRQIVSLVIRVAHRAELDQRPAPEPNHRWAEKIPDRALAENSEADEQADDDEPATQVLRVHQLASSSRECASLQARQRRDPPCSVSTFQSGSSVLS
jgi:hypothetical protein